MQTLTQPLFGLPTKILQLGLLFAALVMAVPVVCFRPGMVPLVFELCLFLALVVFSQLRLANLVIAYVVADHLCQFFKRFIFTLGPQSQMVYYGFQLLPTMLLLVAGTIAVYILLKRRTPPSAFLMIGYVATTILVSLINIRRVPLQSLLGGMEAQIVPVVALLVGVLVPLSFLSRVSKLFILLIWISVPLGVYQLIYGPTYIDRAWAEATHVFSIEAWKLYQSMYFYDAFRPYAYYADHTTWGYFLAMAMLVVIATTKARLLPKAALYLTLPVGMIGLIACETRTPLVALLGACAVYWLINKRVLRRPMLLVLGVLVAFGLVVTVGDYATHHMSFGGTGNAIVNRFATVGTLEARTSAWRLFVRNLPKHWLIGTGYGFGSDDPSTSMGEEIYSHNMFVDILVVTGLPGLIIFLGFFYLWIKEVFWVARMSSGPVTGLALWMIAMAIGMLITGNIQGPLFMTPCFCFFLGMMSGEWLRLQKAQSLTIQMLQPQQRRAPVFQTVGI